MASQIPKKPAPKATPHHVIAEYRHSLQTVTCVCGWTGSTASIDSRPSAWSDHVTANRTPPPR